MVEESSEESDVTDEELAEMFDCRVGGGVMTLRV